MTAMTAAAGPIRAADHDTPLKKQRWPSIRRSSLYQTVFRKRKKSAPAQMPETAALREEQHEEARQQALQHHFFIGTPTSVAPSINVDVDGSGCDDGAAGPSSAEIQPPGAAAPLLRRTQSHSAIISRFGDRLRRSFRLSTRRERAAKIGAVAIKTDIKSSPALLRDFREKTFTECANITIVNYDSSYCTIDLVRQTFQRNRPDEIKQLLRKTHWPVGHKIRADLWQEICRYKNPDFNGYKGCYEPETQGWEDLDGRFTPKVRFLRTPDTIRNNYELNERGLAALHRLIRALDSTNPTLSYAALLRPMLALFLHYMSEADAYACAFRLLKYHAVYMNDSVVARKASSYTLLALVKSYKGAVFKAIKTWIGSSDEDILANALYNWPRWIFCSLPFEYLIRVVDCYLYEGSKILMRVAIALLQTWQKTAKKPGDLASKSCEERVSLFSSSIEQSAKHDFASLPALLEAATGIRNFRGTKIAHLQEKYEKKILNTEGVGAPSPDIPAMHTRPFISKIVSPDVAFQLMCNLPGKFQLKAPVLIYHQVQEGSSFRSLWSKIDEAESTLMIIKTNKGEILGAYCDEAWENRKKREREKGIYFGGGLSFVFNVEGNKHVNVYGWKDKQPECFMAAPTACSLMIGGNAIRMEDELIAGSTMPGNTFNNPELVQGGAFVVEDMEVYKVVEWQTKEEEEKEENLRKQFEEKDRARQKYMPKVGDQSEHHQGDDVGVGLSTFVATPNLSGI